MRTHSQFLGCGLTTSVTRPLLCLGLGTAPHSLQMFTTNVQYLSLACNLHRFYNTEDFALLLPCPIPRSRMQTGHRQTEQSQCSLSALCTPSPRFLAAPAMLQLRSQSVGSPRCRKRNRRNKLNTDGLRKMIFHIYLFMCKVVLVKLLLF